MTPYKEMNICFSKLCFVYIKCSKIPLGIKLQKVISLILCRNLDFLVFFLFRLLRRKIRVVALPISLAKDFVALFIAMHFFYFSLNPFSLTFYVK